MKKLTKILCAVLTALLLTGFIAACNKTVLPMLDAPEGLRVEENYLEWNPVQNAVSYEVQINDAPPATRIFDTAFSLTNLSSGVYKLRVRAVANGYTDSAWSTPYTYINSAYLSAPQNLTVNVPQRAAAWTAVQNASSYTVRINNDLPIENIQEEAFSFADLPAGFHTLRVKAVGDGEVYLDSNFTQTTFSIFGAQTQGLDYNLLPCGTAYEVSAGILDGTAVTIADTYQGLPVTHIANQAFFNQTEIGAVYIPDSVTHIGADAFANCFALQDIRFSENTVRVGSGAFRNTEYDNALRGEVYIGKVFYGFFGPMVVGTQVEIRDLTVSIAPSAFAGRENLANITLPDSLEHIGAGAFSGCRTLTAVDIPASVTHIETLAFFNCRTLTQLNIPSGVTEIPASMTQGCENLESVTIPASVTHIGAAAFDQCVKLIDINIPADIQYIGAAALDTTEFYAGLPNGPMVFGSVFYKYKGSLNVNDFPDGLDFDMNLLPNAADIRLIAASAFSPLAFLSGGVEGLGGLKSVHLANSVTHIGANAFRRCPDLESVILPETVTHIDVGAFSHLPKLTQIELPAGLTFLNEGVFRNSSALESITVAGDTSGLNTLPDGITYIDDHMFLHCTALTQFTISSYVTFIGEVAFSNTGLTAVQLPFSVTFIDGLAFSNTPLTDITIPAAVTLIGDFAFQGCANLQTVTLLRPAAQGLTALGRDALSGTDINKITVPTQACVDAYSAAPNWTHFAPLFQTA